MKRIGVRELRQNASEYLRLVRSGETIEVTERGAPIARLVPITRAGAREQLAASGRLELARGDVLELGAPLRPSKGVRLPSESLAAARSEEE